MRMYTLRPYQNECIDVIEKLDPGSYLVVLATGLGKTMIFSHIPRKGRVLILSHRDELVRQPAKYYDCSFGVEKADETSKGEEVVSASVLSLINRLDSFKPDDFDMIITDEAHHAVAASYRKIYEYFTPRLHLGFTATPKRGDKIGLNKIYKKIIYQKDLRWGITNDYLTDIRCMRVNIGYDLSKVKIRCGDFEQEKLEGAVNQKKMNEGVANAYKKYAVGKTVIFASSVAHAQAISREIKDSMVITASTKNRGEIIEQFQEGKIPCIVNCMVLTEGTDIPAIETIIIARPTVNASLYEQMVGRGLRKFEGKKYLTLIDCVGVTGNLEICTAPSLFGLDLNVVPKKSRGRLSDIMLTEMPEKIDELMDSPDAWILNAERVELFKKDNSLSLQDLNWQLLPDDSMTCPTGEKGHYLHISPTNALGKCDLVISKYNRKRTLCRDQSPDNAILLAREILEKKYPFTAGIWDMKRVKVWGKQPATDGQKKFIGRLLLKPVNKSYEEFDYRNLDKYQASIVIDRLKRRADGSEV